jgi:hypothetical protein
MTLNEVREYIDANGGEREYLINWEWAYFPNDDLGLQVFNHVKAHIEHRGFYPAQPKSGNPNLHRAGFRFR